METATKKWRDMSASDIQSLKRQQCCKCHYFSRNNENKQGNPYVTGICDYLSIEGHSRGCSPLECVEKGVFKLRKGKGEKRKAMRLYA